ncbi:MAG TPA: 50S ribosomal protein L4 [Campylobacterales bacterium]|nr:50S ribosomal protein L4 [Campylobacterales bacterium]
MSKAVVLDSNLKSSGELELPAEFADINTHNLYLYVKSYQAALRANTAHTKTRSDVRGGGKKPFAQKGGGRARAGSIRSPIWVGGGVAHGPKNNRNYFQKINKKQKRLALLCALNEKAENGKLFVVDSIAVESGKTKDAINILKTLEIRSAIVVKELVDEKTFYAFRNVSNAYLIESNELNGYTATAFDSMIIEKNVLENIIKEG